MLAGAALSRSLSQLTTGELSRIRVNSVGQLTANFPLDLVKRSRCQSAYCFLTAKNTDTLLKIAACQVAICDQHAAALAPEPSLICQPFPPPPPLHQSDQTLTGRVRSVRAGRSTPPPALAPSSLRNSRPPGASAVLQWWRRPLNPPRPPVALQTSGQRPHARCLGAIVKGAGEGAAAGDNQTW